MTNDEGGTVSEEAKSDPPSVRSPVLPSVRSPALRPASRAPRFLSSLIPHPSSLSPLLAACLLLLAVAAPHSIAVSQGAWVLGLVLWAARLAFGPRAGLRRTPVDWALLAFVALTVVSSVFSYEPAVSAGKLKAVGLFTVAYLVAENVREARLLRLLVFALVASCAAGVVYTLAERAVGRGIKIVALASDSPLRAAGLREGDVIYEADGARVRTPEDAERALVAPRAGSEVTIYWPDGKPACTSDARAACVRGERAEVPLAQAAERGRVLPGATAGERLGLTSWSRGRDWRATGPLGHYTTYAEVLQLAGSLALGLLVARGARRGRASALLALAVAGMAVALLLTVTRASWIGFAASAAVVVLAGAAGRRVALGLLLAAALAAPAALYVLRQRRGVGLFDLNDASTSWRATVYREGVQMLASSPRHLLVGVGMDTLKLRWREWGMFDRGRLPWGHLHSTPLQIAFERGVPALLAWLWLLGTYARMLWRRARETSATADAETAAAREDNGGDGGDGGDWVTRGLALGALGGAVGFFTSGLVHYNLGDSEVTLFFYLIMGLALAAEGLRGGAAAGETASGRAHATTGQQGRLDGGAG
jgi:O-antigen ligase